MDKLVLDAFNKMDERNTTFIFRLLSLGFKQREITYVKRPRIGGESKWTFVKKMSIMLDAITGFSNRPMRLIAKFGLFIFAVLVVRWTYVLYKVYYLGISSTEFTLIIDAIYTALALQILVLGVMGDYIWRILDETRKRPQYDIRKVTGQIFEE